MMPIHLQIHSRQPDGEIIHSITTGTVCTKANKRVFSFTLQTGSSSPPATCQVVFWRKGLALLETKGDTAYRFRLEEGKQTDAVLTVGTLSTPLTVKAITVTSNDFSSHGNLHLRYCLYSGQALLNENDIEIEWAVKKQKATNSLPTQSDMDE